MNFCPNCGSTTNRRVPDGDNRPRDMCDDCETIHYQNPKIIAGCVALYQNQVLLCRRAIEPRSGLWTLPAGFMENGERSHKRHFERLGKKRARHPHSINSMWLPRSQQSLKYICSISRS